MTRAGLALCWAMFAGTAWLAPRLASAQFSSGVQLVEVYATVTDQAGRAVHDLDVLDFVVEEEGRAQRVDAFARGEFPLAVAIAIDRSFSVPAARLTATVSAARTFLRVLRPDDLVMVLAVGSEIETLAPLSADRALALAALDRIRSWGTTPLYDSVLAALDAIQPARGRRALIMLSDGVDRYSQTTAAGMIAAARRRDVLVYPVSSGKRPIPILDELAAATGGRSFVTADRELATALTSVGDELRHQYLLGYTPAPQTSAPRTWRSIHVRVSRPGVRVRARHGYVSP